MTDYTYINNERYLTSENYLNWQEKQRILDGLFVEIITSNKNPEEIETMNISNKLTISLPNLTSFINLTELVCERNKLTMLPTLPENLRILKCGDNKLTSLPTLPENLEFLGCSDNKLTSLPLLPKNLKFLNCSLNKLTYLPDLPNKLEQLYCSHNKLTHIFNLPKNLKSLNCDCNLLTHLPELPITIYSLSFYSNNIKYIPKNIEFYAGRVTDFTHRTILDINKKYSIHKFRELYYTLKFKKQFREWLWVKVREPATKKLYDPSKLSDLTEEDDLDLYLEKLGWINQEICV